MKILHKNDARQLDFEGKQHGLPAFVEGDWIRVIDADHYVYNGKEGSVVEVVHTHSYQGLCLFFYHVSIEGGKETYPFVSREIRKIR